ncbi:calcium-binding protein [Streptomyces sp. NPDC127068]|uniref:calcium-binding protein n=1 Tax=Streptomyces sp. NPDC127068 TaxID=3347127 RepID=UPI003658026E
MRIRASVAVVTGALALSALSIPSAQAADGGVDLPKALDIAKSAGPSAYSSGAGKITKVTINGGKDVAVGTTKKKFAVEISASDKRGVEFALGFLWRGNTLENATAMLGPEDPTSDPCKYTATSATCKFTFSADPKADLANKDAGNWKFLAMAFRPTDPANLDDDGLIAAEENFKTAKVLRAAKVTAKATPDPIKKGKTLTIGGALTRANWDTNKYAGYTAQPVKLQFKKKGTTSWTTVKTIKSDSRGNLKTTVKAERDGSYRYSFAGTSTTPASNSSADAVDVR